MSDESRYGAFDPQTALVLKMREAAQAIASADLLVKEGAQQIEEAQRQLAGRRYSPTRVIATMTRGGRLDGLEAEVSQECAHQRGVPHDPMRPEISYAALAQALGRRALIAGTGSQGGYIVGDRVPPAVAALFPYMTALRMGATMLSDLTGSDLQIPMVTASATAAWTGEAGTAAVSDQTLGAYVATPKPCAAVTSFSKRLLTQSPEVADRMVAGNLLAVVGAGLDDAILNGTGTSMPTGITNWSGVTVGTGGSFAFSDGHDMLSGVAAGNVNDDDIASLAHPSVRSLFGQRPRDGTNGASGYLWERGQFIDKPASVSSALGTDALIMGAWADVWALLWGGVAVEIDPFFNFKASIQAARVVAYADVAVVRSSSFSVMGGIT